MRRTALAVLVVSLVACGLGASLAEAQPVRQPSAQARRTAREAYSRGQELFRGGQFAEAEAAFREAYAAVPNAIVLVGVAEAQERQDNIDGAIETLQRYLTERADAPDRASIEQRIEGMRSRPGTVVVHSSPTGASVSVDGERRDAVTPAEIDVPPGQHRVEASLEGYEVATSTVEVTAGGRHEVALTLEEAVPVANEDDIFGDGGQDLELDDGNLPPVDADEGGVGTGVWVAAGVCGAGLVAGTVLGFLALSEQSDFDNAPSVDSADRGERYALFADVAFGVAAAAGITALVLYLTSGDDDDADADDAALDVTPTLGLHGGGVEARVQF